MPAAPRRRRWISTRASATPKAAPSMPPPDARCWPTRTASSANTGAPTARSRPCRSRRTSRRMQRDYWYSVARTLKKLESPESVGQTAARRALRRLGARKVKTARVPVIFDPQMARSLLGHIFEAANGDTIYRDASFLAGKLGEQIAGENITVIDDGTMPGRLRHQSVRRRRRAHPPHGGHRKRRAEVLPAEHLRRQEAWPARPPATPRAGWPASPASAPATSFWSRASARRNRSSPTCQDGLYRDRVSRLRGQPGDRRFFPRRQRPVDSRTASWPFRSRRLPSPAT